MGVTGLCDSLARVLACITILLLRVYHVKERPFLYDINGGPSNPGPQIFF